MTIPEKRKTYSFYEASHHFHVDVHQRKSRLDVMNVCNNDNTTAWFDFLNIFFNRGLAIWQLHSAFMRALMSSC